MSRKRAITTFLSRKSMITRLSIAFEDFLGSSIAPQVMPPWTSPMFASSCVTSVRDNMRTWGGLPQILTSHHSLVLHSQPERPKDDCAGITQLLCFSLLSSFCSSRDILNLPSCEGFILPKPFWSQKSNLPILQPNALNNQMNFGVLHWLHQVPLVVKWYVNFDYFKILSDDPSHILASRRTDCLPHTYWIHSERHWSVELQNHNGKLVIITA